MEDPCSWGYYTVACLHVMWGWWPCDGLSKVTTWHELHENCKVWCTQVGWGEDICSRLLKHGCDEKCMRWEFFLFDRSARCGLQHLWSHWEGKDWKDFLEHKCLGMVEVRMLPWIYLFFLSDVLLCIIAIHWKLKYLNVLSVTLAVFGLTWLWIGTESNWALITFQI